MDKVQPGIYFGKVTHKRMQPVAHELAYTVASVFVDVDRLDALPSLMSYNRFNLFALYDKDFGKRDHSSISAFAWGIARNTKGAEAACRIFMLCYPRMLGYGFNPLTVYFVLDEADKTLMTIYEVHNTFGGSHSYVTEITSPNFHKTEKVFRVSPFNKVEGQYGLRVSEPREKISVGVALETDKGPILKAYFAGTRETLSNVQLLRLFFGLPLMTVKVIAGIHWEALKLWWKGLKLES